MPNLGYNIHSMSNHEHAPLLPFTTQLENIKKSQDLTSYKYLQRSYLDLPDDYIGAVEYESTLHPAHEPSPSHYQLLGLVSTLVSQAGFESQDGQLFRHKRNKWKKPLIDVRHQLSVASYLGNINAQTYPLRADWINKLGYDSRIPLGLWGSFISVSNGQVIEPIEQDINALFRKAKIRSKSPLPICLPVRDLNQGLAELNFTGHDAENMSDEEFMDKIYPKAKQLLSEIIDVPKLFDVNYSSLPFSGK